MKKIVSMLASGVISLTLVSPALSRKSEDTPRGPAAQKVKQLKKSKNDLGKMVKKAKAGNAGRQLGRAMNSLCKTKRALERADCAHQFNKNKETGMKVKFKRPKPSSSSSASSAASSEGSSSSASSSN
ncbi:MAG: hypothetical protein AAB489_04930 [Patescibacteria group bacterium]